MTAAELKAINLIRYSATENSLDYVSYYCSPLLQLIDAIRPLGSALSAVFCDGIMTNLAYY